MIEWYYVLMIVWAIVITTYVLTRAFGIADLKVVEVKEIDRTPDIKEYVEEYIIDRNDYLLNPQIVQNIEGRHLHDALAAILNRIFEEKQFEYYSIEECVPRIQTKCMVRIKILPPKKVNNGK